MQSIYDVSETMVQSTIGWFYVKQQVEYTEYKLVDACSRKSRRKLIGLKICRVKLG